MMTQKTSSAAGSIARAWEYAEIRALLSSPAGLARDRLDDVGAAFEQGAKYHQLEQQV